MPPEPLTPDKQLSVGKVARFCQVNRVTVQRWIHAGKLKAHSLPGGHYRVCVADLREFFITNRMPLPRELLSLAGAGRSRILLVDDSKNDRNLLKTVLSEINCEVEIDECGSGIDALLRIGDWKPDLVMLDIRMPGMDGYEVVRKLSRNPLTAGIKVVVVTGYPRDKSRRNLEDSPVVAGIFEKPIDIVKLREKVEEILTTGREQG